MLPLYAIHVDPKLCSHFVRCMLTLRGLLGHLTGLDRQKNIYIYNFLLCMLILFCLLEMC